MNYKMIGRIQGFVLLIEIAFMLPSVGIALFTGDTPALKGFIVAIAAAAIVGGLLIFLSRAAKKKFYAKEGMVAVGLCWIVMSLIGCLPFFISGRIPNYIDALFEIVSGFTTTGASIVPEVESLGKALLFWRSFSHWIGGMGVLVFFLAIVPISGNNEGFTLHILRAESPGPSVNKMVPRMKQSAKILYIIYVIMTVLNIIFLLIGKMELFDAFCIAFGTAGTGGFSILSTGCATYTPFAQNVTTIFMLLFGVNFGVYYLLIVRDFLGAFRDEELRLYLLIVGAAILFIALNIFRITSDTQSVEETIRHAAFQVASIITTTGYSTVDFDLWPALSRGILLFLMFVGACAGSTGGGLKVVRLLLLERGVRRNAHQMFHTKEVKVIRFNGSRVSEQTMNNINSYLAVYVLIVIASFLLLCADGGEFSLMTHFSAVMATFNNIGPGLEAVGPTQNFSIYGNFGTLVMVIDMLLGRLEIFPILALLFPGTWKK